MKNTGVSCEFTKYGSNEYILCIYETYRTVAIIGWDNDIFFSFFQINQESISLIKNKDFDKQFFIYIRSTTKSINSKPFFCGITENNIPECLIYDYNDLNSEPYYDDGYEKKCINKPYNIKTYYFPETGEYVFTVYTDAVKNADFVLGMSTIQAKSFVTTGIKEINTNSEKVQSKKSGCYDLSGRKVSESNTTNGLKPGIYIINGRKTVIR
jgi:hypothetical protein